MSRSGFVLRLVDVGEADRIASVLFSDGREEVRLPSARRSRKRFPNVGVLHLLDWEIPERSGHLRADQAQPSEGAPPVPTEPVGLALGSLVAEWLLLCTPEGPHDDERFRLMAAALRSLSPTPTRPRGWARAFELKLLAVLGVRPALQRCVQCAQPWDGHSAGAFSAALGGMTFGPCGAEEGSRKPISADDLRCALQAMHLPLARHGEVPWTDANEARVDAALRPFLALHVGRPTKVRSVLDALLGPLPTFALLALVLILGCTPDDDDSVSIQGWATVRSDPPNAAPTISGLTIEAIGDDGRALGQGAEPYSDAPGFYRVDGLPPETSVHLLVTGTEDRPGMAVLSGRTAADDLWLDPGVLHHPGRLDLDQWAAAWRAILAPESAPPEFSSDIDGEGGFIRGRLTGVEAGARLLFRDALGTEIVARSLDDAGRPAPDAAALLDSGRFDCWGLAEGAVSIEVLGEAGARLAAPGATWAIEDGVTSLPGLSVP